MSISVPFIRIMAFAVALTLCAATSAFSQSVLQASENGVDFGTVQLGSTATQTITITNVGSSPVVIVRKNVYPTNGEFKATINTNLPYTLGPREVLTVALQFSPTTNGVKYGNLVIGGQDTAETVSVGLQGNTTTTTPPARMTFTPAGLIDFGNVRVRTTSTLTVSVTNSSNVAQSIISAQFMRNRMGNIFAVTNTLPQSVAAGTTVSLNITANPKRLGDFSDILMVYHGVPGTTPHMDTFYVTCTGVQRIKSNNGGSELVISNPKNQTGDVNVGKQNTLSYTVVNSGTEDMIIESATMDGKDKALFTVSNTFPLVIKAGTTDKLNLVCQPTAAGELEASLMLAVKDAGTTDIPVVATASGVSSREEDMEAALLAYPNPASERVLVMLPANSSRVEILNAAGTLVRTFDAAQASSVQWNATDAAGNRVANGVYFVRIHTAQGMRTAKVVLQD